MIRMFPYRISIIENQRAWWIALVVLLRMGAIGVFIDLADDVETADHITVVDLQSANWLHAPATLRLTPILFR